MSAQEQCRSCLNTEATAHINYHSFNVCTNLEAKVDDDLPGMMCTSCSHDLQVAYNFIRMARHSDAALRDNLALRTKSDSDASFSIKDQEYEMVTERLELLEEEEVNEEDEVNEENEEEEECVVESLDDDAIAHMEEMELEDVEEHVLEEESMEANNSFVEEKPQIQYLLTELAHRTMMQHQPNIKIKKELQSSPDFYAEDELDHRYLIEYKEHEDVTNESIKLTPSATKWKCFECKRVLRGDVSFEGHMNMHKNVRPYKCTQCQCAFRCKIALESHISMRHQEKSPEHNQQDEHQPPDNCSMCAKVFVSASETEEHIQLVHSYTTEVQCPHCSHLAPLPRLKLSEHFRNKHPAEFRKHFPTVGRPTTEPVRTTPWQCEICTRYFRSESLLSDHCNIHLNERPYECQCCLKRFATAVNMRQHMRLIHPEYFEKISQSQTADDDSATGTMMTQCELCKKQLLSKNFEKHMALHEKKEREASEAPTKFLCAYCYKEFATKLKLRRHEEIHNPTRTRKHSCEQCEAKFYTRFDKEHHVRRVHTITERSFACCICGNLFKENYQLRNHMKLHEQRILTCQHCNKNYARQIDLDIHMRTHTGELPFACQLCDKRFAIKVRLTYHLQKHYGVKHECGACGAIYNSRCKLRIHMFKHTGMPYRCEDCPDAQFSKRERFRNHIQRIHNRTPTNEELDLNFERNTGKTVHIKDVSNKSVMQQENEAPALDVRVDNVAQEHCIEVVGDDGVNNDNAK